MRKVLLVTLAILVALGIVWYTWKFFGPSFSSETIEKGQIVASRSEIDPSTFKREDALAALALLEAQSPFSYETRDVSTSPTTAASWPPELSDLLEPAPGETVKVGKGQFSGKNYYSASYFSEIAMPENYTYLMRVVGRDGFKILKGSRGLLASIFEAEGKAYKLKVYQLAVSENRTEIMIYALEK